MKIDAFHYVQLGTAYRSVLPRPCPVPPAHARAPLWTGGLCASTQGPPACARRRGDRALWGHPAHPSLPDERLLRQGRRPPTAAQAARSVHSGAQCLHPGVPALTPKPHCPWVPRAGGLAQPVLLPQGPSIKQFMDIFSLPEMALLSCVVDHFLGHGLEFDQAHLYKDVTVRAWACAPGCHGREPRHSRAGHPGLQ